MASLEIASTGIVYQNPKPYLRSIVTYHPSLVVSDDGELLAGFDLGQAVEALDYHTVTSRSLDGGQSWSEPVPLLSAPLGERPSTHSIRISRAGNEILGFGGLYYRDDPEEGLVNRQTLGYVPVELLLARSQDRGRTWVQPRFIDPPLQAPGWEICHGIVQLANGRWLAPTAPWRGWSGENPAGEQAVVLISDSRGRMWSTYGRVFDGSQSGLLHWEQSIIPLHDGRVLAVAWMHDPSTGANLPTPYTLSQDFGETWSSPKLTGLQGQTCKGIQLKDGRIFCAYRRNDKPGLWGNLAAIDGDSWINLAETPIWQGASSGMTGVGGSADELAALRFGYPTIQQLPDGDIFLVFWCVEGLVTLIRWVRIQVDTL